MYFRRSEIHFHMSNVGIVVMFTVVFLIGGLVNWLNTSSPFPVPAPLSMVVFLLSASIIAYSAYNMRSPTTADGPLTGRGRYRGFLVLYLLGLGVFLVSSMVLGLVSSLTLLSALTIIVGLSLVGGTSIIRIRSCKPDGWLTPLASIAAMLVALGVFMAYILLFV